jgi:predicted nucleic acid-binding protein
VATAEQTYVDPSALLKLYLHEAESAAMNRWRQRTTGPLPVAPHGRLEITNDICLAAFRGLIGVEAMRHALASLDNDFDEGRYVPAEIMWRATMRRAIEISRVHTLSLGCRSLDVLHVATALELGVRAFLTFDARRKQLARAVGMKTMTPQRR